jgi:citrate lyase synthetase
MLIALSRMNPILSQGHRFVVVHACDVFVWLTIFFVRVDKQNIHD